MHSVARLRFERPRASRPRRPERGDARVCSRATVDEEIERVFLELPDGDDGARADRRPRRGGAGAAAHAHPRRRRPDSVIRTHGDYHLGQTMLGRRRLGDPRLRGRAAAHVLRAPPQALAAARRRRDAALVRVRRDRGVASCAAPRRPTAGRQAARTQFLDGYLGAVDRSAAAARRSGDRQAARRLRAREGASTSSATSWTTAPTGWGSPWRGILRLMP